MKIAGRKIRASWQQIGTYILGAAIALRPFAIEHDFSDLLHMKHLVEFLQIVLGSIILFGARSPIQRKEWEPLDRKDKTQQAGKDTPPSV